MEMQQDYKEANKPTSSTSSILGTPKGLALITFPYKKKKMLRCRRKGKVKKSGIKVKRNRF